jgi:O-antigen/teichoic acid export membrane protein
MPAADALRLAEPAPTVRSQYLWTITEQAIASLTTLAAASLTARSVGTSEFGEFGLLFAVYLLVVGISRTCTSEPLAVRQARFSGAERDRASSSAASLAVVVGLVAAVVVLALAGLVQGELSAAVIALGVALPLLLLQDCLRQVMIIGGRARSAALNGSAWLVLSIVGFVLVGPSDLTVAWAVTVWAMGGCAAAMFGLLQTRVALGRGATEWLRRQGDLSSRYLGEYLLALASGHMLVVLVAAFAGLSAAGGVRGAQVVVGPLTVVFGAISTQAVPHLARSWDRQEILDRHTRRLSMTFVGIAVVFFGLLLAIPESLGRELLGDSWGSTRDLLGWFALSYVAIGAAGGAVIGLRATGRARQALSARIVTTVVTTGLVAFGLVFGEVRDAIAGLAIGQCLSVLVWWGTWRSRRSASIGSGGVG